MKCQKTVKDFSELEVTFPKYLFNLIKFLSIIQCISRPDLLPGDATETKLLLTISIHRARRVDKTLHPSTS